MDLTVEWTEKKRELISQKIDQTEAQRFKKDEIYRIEGKRNMRHRGKL